MFHSDSDESESSSDEEEFIKKILSDNAFRQQSTLSAQTSQTSKEGVIACQSSQKLRSAEDLFESNNFQQNKQLNSQNESSQRSVSKVNSFEQMPSRKVGLSRFLSMKEDSFSSRSKESSVPRKILTQNSSEQRKGSSCELSQNSKVGFHSDNQTKSQKLQKNQKEISPFNAIQASNSTILSNQKNSQIKASSINSLSVQLGFPSVDIPQREDDLLISKKKFKEIDSFFADWEAGKSQSILILTGSSGVGKKSIISYLAIKKYGMKITYVNTLQQFENCSFSENLKQQDNNSIPYQQFQQNPLDLLIFAFNRSLSPKLYNREVVVLQELPINPSFIELQKIQSSAVQRYLNKTFLPKNPLIFILNDSIYSPSQINKVIKEQFKDSCTIFIKEIYLPKPSDKEIEVFVKKQIFSNQLFSKITGDQKNAVIQEVVTTASGDISNANNQLRMIEVGRKVFFSKEKRGKEQKQKDNEFSIFHTLGKFLYNKRILKGSKEKPKQMSKEELLSGQTDYYFNPAVIIRQSNCSPCFFRNALQQNYLDFYHTIEDTVQQSSLFAELDILEGQNFMEKNEALKEENEFLLSRLGGEGVMINNLSGKETQKKFVSITKSQVQDLQLERKRRMLSIRKTFPHISTRKYVSEYNHHLTMHPKIIAADMIKQKGQWKQTKIIDQNAMNINSIGFDAISDDPEQINSTTQNDPESSKPITLTSRPLEQIDILEDDIEEC